MSPTTYSSSRTQLRPMKLEVVAQNRPRTRTRNRRTVSCLPCRLHKLRCDQAIPCQSCCRYRREDQCRRNPPPGGEEKSSVVLPRLAADADRRPVPQHSGILDLPPSPLSVVAAEQDLSSDHVREHIPGNGRAAFYVPNVNRPQQHTAHRAHSLGGTGDLSDPVQVTRTPTVMSIASLILRNPSSANTRTLLDEEPMYWKRYLAGQLPTQTQCDILVSYFFENINWVYQAIHAPSFRTEYARFWSLDVSEIDLIWLALLYMMLCMSVLYIPSDMAEMAGFDVTDLGLLSRRWYAASRQALQSGGYDCKPTITQIQVFLVSQLYLYGTKNVEALNSWVFQRSSGASLLTRN